MNIRYPIYEGVYRILTLQQLLSNLHQNDTCSEYGKNTVRIPHAGNFLHVRSPDI